MDEISLQSILDGFNAPLNEEQAWAVCYQCANYLQSCWDKSITSAKQCFEFAGLDYLYLGKDGHISRIEPVRGLPPVKSQTELVQCIGVLIYQALDFGLRECEEHSLSPGLEELIDRMTEGQKEEDGEKDEGIEDEEDSCSQSSSLISLQDVLQLCCDHLPTQSKPSSHYKAVCRALVTESIELTTFLEAVSSNKTKLKAVNVQEQPAELQLEQLQRADWARLWMQVMRELRSGRENLKKIEELPMSHASFELTPYEALMKDIKDKKYQLKQVTVHDGDIAPNTKKDAHDIILDFIRSRPPLHPVRERKCQRSPMEPKPLELREQLLLSIRSDPKLKPTPSQSRLVETSRTKLDDTDSKPMPAKKIIKPNMSFQLNSFSDSDSDTSDDDTSTSDALEDRNKVEAHPFSPITPLSPKSSPVPLMSPPSQWHQTVLHTRSNPLTRSNHVSGSRPVISRRTSVDPCPESSQLPTLFWTQCCVQRNSITVCESPNYGAKLPARKLENTPRLYPRALKRTTSTIERGSRPRPCSLKRTPSSVETRIRPTPVPEVKRPQLTAGSIERLSLTMEEVMHIRNVLTKAELESLLVKPDLHEQVAKGKVCFTCLKTKFSLFGAWSTKCKMCQRYVCSRCVSKMKIPTEHFESIPVSTLGPSPFSTSQSKDDLYLFDNAGSEPNSPDIGRKTPSSDKENDGKPRRKVARSATLRQSPNNSTNIKGTEMSLCRDCKAMIINIIKSSRVTVGANALAFALGMNSRGSSVTSSPGISSPNIERHSSDTARASLRNFRLDLKPVYKAT